MTDETALKVAMATAIWQSNLIGLTFGVWIGTAAVEVPLPAVAVAVVAWLTATGYVWGNVRRKFWPAAAG